MMYKKKRHIRIGRLLLLLLIPLVLAGAGVTAYRVLAKNPYEAYDVYDEGNKKYGELQHYTEEKEDAYYLSYYYPKYENKALNAIVQNYKKHEILTGYQHKGKKIISIDYASDRLYGQYVNITFTQNIWNEDGKLLHKEMTHYTFDEKQNKLLQTKDILRRNYKALLASESKKAGFSQASMQVQLGKEDVTFYNKQGDKHFRLPYAKIKAYIRLNNSQIPSLYQGEVIVPKKQNIDPNKPMIAFTFDDGPHYQNTQIIMSEFEKYDGRATFFMLGQNVKSAGVDNTAIVQDVYRRGFELGNHSWDHSMAIAAYKTNYMSKAEVAKEIYDTQDAIYAACGSEPTLFRPPYGALNKNVRAVSTLDFALWDLDTEDWSNKNADIITNNIMKNVHDGSVILLHDIHDFSRDAIKQVLPKLNAAGYQFVSLSTLQEYNKGSLEKENVILPAEVK